MILIILSTSLLLFYLIFIIQKWKFLKFAWNNNGFFVPVLPFIGNMYAPYLYGVSENVTGALDTMGRKFGYPFNLWYGHEYCYFTTEPAVVKAVLHNSSSQDKGGAYGAISALFKNCLLTAPYNVWKLRRRHYAKSFKPQSLKVVSEIYYKGSTDLVENIKSEKKEDINYEFFTKYAFSNFFRAASGMDKLPKRIFNLGEYFLEFQEDVAQKMLNPQIPADLWIRYHPRGKNAVKFIQKELTGICEEIVEEKKKLGSDLNAFDESENTPPLLDVMISIEGSLLDTDHIPDELVFFSTAASDTSGHALMIGFTLLGMNPEVQEKVYKEVMTTVGHKSISSDDLPALVYTEACVHEILRLFPVIPIVTRRVYKDIDVGTQIIPKGTTVGISIFNLHRDEKYWPNPLKFDPTRFLPENADNIVPFSYVAFSSGPRDCIGKAQAIAMMKISLANVVRNFKISSKHKSIEELKVMSAITLRTISQLDCHFEPR